MFLLMALTVPHNFECKVALRTKFFTMTSTIRLKPRVVLRAEMFAQTAYLSAIRTTLLSTGRLAANNLVPLAPW
jgi:hypothetical protein